MSLILSFLATSLGRYVGIGLGAAVMLGGFMWQQQAVGKRKERVRIEKQDRTNVSKAARAASASRDPQSRGLRDRYIRND